MNIRGLVGLPSTYQFGKGGSIGLSLDWDRDVDVLKNYLTYWDMVDFPITNAIRLDEDGEPPEYKWLMDAGILKRSRVVFPFEQGFRGDLMGWCTRVAPELVAAHRNSKGESLWVLSTPSRPPGAIDHFFAEIPAYYLDVSNRAEMYSDWRAYRESDLLRIESTPSRIDRTLEIELYGALPAPPTSVSIEDVLEFKQKRKDELESLRYAMDALYLEVIESADVPRKSSLIIKRISDSIGNLHRLHQESWGQRLLLTLTVELNLSNVVSGSIMGAAAASALRFPMEIGAGIGASASTIKFTLPIREKVIVDPLARDLSYTYRVESELR